MEYDILIKNASIIDGTGAPAFAGDTAVSGDLITAVVPGGSREPGRQDHRRNRALSGARFC